MTLKNFPPRRRWMTSWESSVTKKHNSSKATRIPAAIRRLGSYFNWILNAVAAESSTPLGIVRTKPLGVLSHLTAAPELTN